MNYGKRYRSLCKTLVIGAAAFITPVYTDRLAWGAAASGSAISLPDINVSIGGTQGAGGTAVTVQILMLLTVLSLGSGYHRDGDIIHEDSCCPVSSAPGSGDTSDTTESGLDKPLNIPDILHNVACLGQG